MSVKSYAKLLFLFSAFILNKLIVSENDDCFRAAVFQHISTGNESLEEPNAIINRNLDIFEEIASKASKAVRI